MDLARSTKSRARLARTLGLGLNSVGRRLFVRLARIGTGDMFKAKIANLALSLLLFLAISRPANAQATTETAIGDSNVSKLLQKMESERTVLQKQFGQVIAKGRVTGWVQTPGSTNTQGNLDAELLILLDGAKFHLQLLHAAQPQATPPIPERLEIAIFDGKSIYSFLSTPETKRGGVYFEFSQSAVLRSTGYPFSTLLNYWDDAITLKELDSRAMTVTDLGTNGLILKEDRATYMRQIFLGKKNQFDLERVALRHPGAAVAFREHWLTWRELDDFRYVQHYVVRHRYAIRDAPDSQITARQYEVDIDSFNHHVQHDEKKFALEGLGIPAGTTFIDYRRNIKGKRATMIWNGSSLIESDLLETP